MKIRKSKESEKSKILNIHTQAFGKKEGSDVTQLVTDLFDDETALPMLSLVAVDCDRLIGHILFTKVEVSGSENPVVAQLLAPLAVLPEDQSKGVGEKLINEGLRLLKESGTELVFVLGHPTYYPRCGFIPAGEKGYDAPYPIPEEHAGAWMVLGLIGDVMNKNSGEVQCSRILNDPQHWRE